MNSVLPIRSPLNITITYRKTSRLSIRITKTEELHVSVPIGFPKRDVVKFIEANRPWIEKAILKHRQELQLRKKFYDRLPLRTEEERNEAAGRLHAIVAPLVDRYAQLMNVHPSGIGYRVKTSNWGSCNIQTKRIIFNTYLLLLPEPCIEHVVVHELAHLIEPDHGAGFHAIMDRYFPRWKEVRAMTRAFTTRRE